MLLINLAPDRNLTPMQRWDRRYAASPKGRIAKRRQAAKSHAKKRALLDEIKSTPCADCGLRLPPVCMDFDHRPGSVKEFAVSTFGLRGRARLLAEIAKCDVVCANCHRIRTHERNTYRQRR